VNCQYIIIIIIITIIIITIIIIIAFYFVEVFACNLKDLINCNSIYLIHELH